MDSAAAALRYWEQKQAVVANNLANASTDGFKGERVFANLLNGALPVAQTATDQTAGTLRQTGVPTDVALPGPGYFVVSTSNGERLSRGGSLEVNATHQLVDSDGHPVLGDKGPITLRNGQFDIDSTGQIKQDGKVVDRLRVETVPAGTELTHEGGTLLVPPADATAVPPNQRNVKQGAVEQSNVNSLGSLVDMVSVQRAYSAVQKAIVELDSAHETAATQLAKPL